MRIAETPGSDNFNPFYIYGGSGLGKLISYGLLPIRLEKLSLMCL